MDQRLEIFGKRVKSIRKSLGLTQKEFSEKIGFQNNYISALENGKVNPNFDFFKQLKSVFNISLDELICSESVEYKVPVVHLQQEEMSVEDIESNQIQNLNQLYWLIENCSGFRHSVIGYGVDYIYRYKGIVLDALRYWEKKNKPTLKELEED